MFFSCFAAAERFVYILQDKKVPLHIRRAFYDAHSEMDHTTTKLEAAAQDLKKCLENILHEDDLQTRARSMTADHYQSLKQMLAGRVGGHKESAMLHWLQLSMNSGQGNERIEIKQAIRTLFRLLSQGNNCIVQWF